MKSNCLIACILCVLTCGCCSVVSLPEAKAKVEECYTNGEIEAEQARVMARATAQIEAAKNHFPNDKLAVVLDVDDTALSTYEYQHGMGFGHNGKLWHQWIAMQRATAIKPVLEFCKRAKELDIALFFVSGRREAQQKDTEMNLRQCGFPEWNKMYVKPDAYRNKSVIPYKIDCRKDIVAKGYRIVANIGDQKSDLEGGYADACFLLPNLIYFVP